MRSTVFEVCIERSLTVKVEHSCSARLVLLEALECSFLHDHDMLLLIYNGGVPDRTL